MNSTDYPDFREQLLASLVKLTQATKFLSPSEVPFITSDPLVASKLSKTSENLLSSLNQVIHFATGSDEDLIDGVEKTVEENYDLVVDLIDDLLEKADICLDSTRKKARTSLTALPNPTNTKFLLRSQLQFKDKINNSNTQWLPIIKEKTHSRTPLIALDPAHPYNFEISNIVYPDLNYSEKDALMYEAIDTKALNWISTLESLESLCSILDVSEEIAVDLEHHDQRSYQGFTCLIQISTREEDYIIDALELRSELHRLNSSFTNPNIVKVFHGAEMDIKWLQRDFGVYVVNLFDTYHASHLLELMGHSFAFLLQTYCNITADKKYQLSDWRARPLSAEMIHYARSDTHYLLYIYDVMRNSLLKASDPIEKELLKETLDRSANTSLNVSDSMVYDGESGNGSRGWRNLLKRNMDPMNEENMSVFKAVHKWRDSIARREDESTTYVLPTSLLFKLCRFMPITSKGVITGCLPTPPLIRLYSIELARVIEGAINVVRNAINTNEVDATPLSPMKEPVHVIFPTTDVEMIVEPKVHIPLQMTSRTLGILSSLDLAPSMAHVALEIQSTLVLEASTYTEVSKIETVVAVVKKVESPAIIETPTIKKRKKEIKIIRTADEIIEFENEPKVKRSKVKVIENFKPFDYDAAELMTTPATKSKKKTFKQTVTDVDASKATKTRSQRAGNKSISFQ